MKKIQWIFVGMILLLSISNVYAVTGGNTTYIFNGDGTPTYPNEGYIIINQTIPYTTTGLCYADKHASYSDSRSYTINYYMIGSMSLRGNPDFIADYRRCVQSSTMYGSTFLQNPGYKCKTINSAGTDYSCKDLPYTSTVSKNISSSASLQDFSVGLCGKASDQIGSGWLSGKVVLSILVTNNNTVSISGNISCIDNVSLYLNNEIIGTVYNNSSYKFADVLDNTNYKLIFSDGHEYDLTTNGNTVYDYDGCGHCLINLNDECANLLNGAFAVIYDKDTNMSIIYLGYDNPINISSYYINENDELSVIWSTWYNGVQKTCYAQFDHDINLYDPFVYWNMEINVYDNETNPISGANVDFNQDCVINGYPTRNKYTDSNGLALFTQCENDNANLVVSKDGYKTLSTSVSGGWYDVYTPTYQVSVTLESTDSEDDNVWDVINDSINDTNATEMPDDIPGADGTPIDINIYFRNMKGDYVNQINDTDNYVRCYYSVNTLDDVNMTLVFQKSFTGYYFYNVYEYTSSIDNNSYGYFNISNSYFNNSDYSYRAYIYDVSYPFDDRYAYLNVINVTNQSETHYENLTGYCMFMNTNKNGSIDYREDITCYAYIVSDNTLLKTISLELYDNSTLIEYKNLTYSDFTDDIYGWYLGYNYTLGHNYSLVLKGYDNSILDIDNVIAYNIVGNKLTVKVTDTSGHDLIHAYVFVEHYGSINTGYLNYGAFEGLPDGESRYKASKTGYRTGAWSAVNLTDENEIVTYQLIKEIQEGSMSQARISDNDMKDLYYPLMYFLLILMLVGALINVIK